MKKGRIIAVISATVLILILVSGLLYLESQRRSQGIVYNAEGSSHGSFYFENEYVIVKDFIRVSNPTKKDMKFYMYADMSEDYGLVNEKIVPACEKNTLKKQVFYIRSESEQAYAVYFKAKNGNKKTKTDRLPPNNIMFEVME